MTQETLQTALTQATAFWETKGPSSRMMATRARTAIDRSGLPWDTRLSTLKVTHGTTILIGLQCGTPRALSKGSIVAYYAACVRMLRLAGVRGLEGWPQPGQPPRRVREPMLRDDLESLIAWLERRGWTETADLARVLIGTGMRVDVEALSWDAWSWVGGPERAALEVTGKGQHQRWVPLGDALRTLMRDTERMRAMRLLTYSGHLKRWKRGTKALDITSKLPTPHAVRHLYATECYERSGKDLMAVKELLGHADVQTTARYVGVDMAVLRQAAGV